MICPQTNCICSRGVCWQTKKCIRPYDEPTPQAPEPSASEQIAQIPFQVGAVNYARMVVEACKKANQPQNWDTMESLLVTTYAAGFVRATNEATMNAAPMPASNSDDRIEKTGGLDG